MKSAHDKLVSRDGVSRYRGSGCGALTARLMLGSVATAALLIAAGCGPVRLVATTNIPTPLVVKIPVAVALYVPKEFSGFIHKEERAGTDWNVDLGKAQSEGLTRLLTAMFDRVVMVDSINAASQLGPDVRAILEPSIEEYAFVTPRDAGSPFFAVSIKYRVNVYSPDGRLADSWGFTGYGTAPAQGITSNAPLTRATALALRDAGAKLAVEFREQAIVRGLLPETVSPDLPALTIPATQTPGAASPAPQITPPPAESAPPPGESVQPPPEVVTPPAEPPSSQEEAPQGESSQGGPSQDGTEAPPANPQPESKPEDKVPDKVPEPPPPESLV